MSKKIALIAFATVCLLLVGIYVEAHVYQTRAERLFRRVSTLQVGESTGADAERLAQSYAPDVISREGNCDQRCYFEIALVSRWYWRRFDWPILRHIGVRPARADVYVSVNNNRISRWGFGVSYKTSPGHWLDVTTSSIEDFSPYGRCTNPSLLHHPNYAVRQGTITTIGGGETLRVAVKQKATNEERSHARRINFGCLTQVPDCESLGDVMPDAYSDFLSDRKWESANPSAGSFMQTCLRELSERFGPPPWNQSSF